MSLAYKVVLLTGAPASGKSTLVKTLSLHLEPLEVLDFGRLLLRAKRRFKKRLRYETIRGQSARILSAKDVADVDDHILKLVCSLRRRKNVLIDSHAVTLEHFGFRIIASNSSLLRRMKLDAVIVLRCPTQERLRRISAKSEGRLMPSPTQADIHQNLQECVAVVYGIISPCPVFVLEASGNVRSIMNRTKEVFDSIGMKYMWTSTIMPTK